MRNIRFISNSRFDRPERLTAEGWFVFVNEHDSRALLYAHY